MVVFYNLEFNILLKILKDNNLCCVSVLIYIRMVLGSLEVGWFIFNEVKMLELLYLIIEERIRKFKEVVMLVCVYYNRLEYLWVDYVFWMVWGIFCLLK